MGALCHQPFGLGRQPSGGCVRLLGLGAAKYQFVSRIAGGDTERAFVAFLTSLGWRPSAAPIHSLDTLLMFGRVRNAVADVAETLRRAYAGLTVVVLPPEPFLVHHQGEAMLLATVQPGLDRPATVCSGMRLLEEAVEGRALEPFDARLCAEKGWARWGAEAEVIRMAPLTAGLATQIAVPPLPRRVPVRGALEPPSRPAARALFEPLKRPGTRRLEPGLGTPPAQSGLEAMLSQGIPIQGEDVARLAKGLWMRYSLQLVRGTGENVRNLEVLGLFRIPRKGVTDLRHDPRQNRIFIRLEAAATRAPRVPFILARRKDDGSLLSCFVEDP